MISLPTFRGVLSGFNPLSLSPALWLNDTGSDPSVWTDMSGNGRNGVQAVGVNQPSIVTNAINGRQVRRFDGTNSFLPIPSGLGIFNNVPGATIIVAYKWISNPIINKIIFHTSVNSNGGQARATMSAGSTARKLIVGGRRPDETGYLFVTSSADNTNSYFVHSALFDFANSDLFQYINGSVDGQSTSFHTNGNTSNSDSFYVGVGASNDATSRANVDIAEILVFATALSTTNRQRVERYLSGKYAIAF